MYAVLRRYSHALDCVDLGKAFLQLWGLLEQLTATQSMSYDITIRRASFVFIEQPYARLRLSVLRDFRNASVHSGEEQADIEAQVFLLKQHVERLLEFHIAHCDRYASIVEAAEFLDNPTSRAAIDQRIEKLKLARRYVVNA
ncbi:hypothetical protein IP84_03855 [beta proteobacterium AAP99]|nr:hypothetical protein IP84_03855 [beta proteobacterium AAP99]